MHQTRWFFLLTLSLRPGVGLNVASDMKVPSVDTVSPLRPGIGLNIASDSKVPSVDTVFPLKPGVGLNISMHTSQAARIFFSFFLPASFTVFFLSFFLLLFVLFCFLFSLFSNPLPF